MPTLSSLIVEREVATMRQVEEALARQVLYGGDLATNLLELATVSEGALSFMLAETHGVEAAPAGELPISRQETLRLLPGDVALRHGLYPLGVRDGALEVAVSEPLPQVVEDDLAFALGVSLRQKAAPLVRIRQAIARDYGLPLDRRYLRLVAKLDGRADPSPSVLPPPNERPLELARLPRPASIPPIAYGRSGGTMLGLARVEPPASTIHVAPSTVEQLERELSHATATTHVGAAAIDEIERQIAHTTQPVERTSRTKTLTGLSAPTPPVQTAVASESASTMPAKRDLAPPSDFVMEASAATAAEVERKRRLRATKLDPRVLVGWAQRAGSAEADARRGTERRLGPVTAAVAEGALDEATTRDGVLGAFFDFARQYFEYSALFVVHADLAAGWDSFGPGADRERITGIGVPLDLPSVLAEARDERIPIVAPLKRNGMDAVLADDLAREVTQPILALPLVVRERTVAILYGDHGQRPVELSSVGEVIALAPLASRAFERLILRRKLASRALAPTPVAAHGSRSDLPPPPANAVAVRPLTDRPIPREEPDDAEVGGPEVHVAELNDDVEALEKLLAEAAEEGDPEAPSPPAAASAVGISRRDEAAATPDSMSMSVSARPPPVSHTSDATLPAVLLHADLVDRVVAGGEDGERAFGEILVLGEGALPAVFARFPGPVTVDHARSGERVPRAPDAGPLLRLVSGMRRLALPFLVVRSADADPDVRFWATSLLGELQYPDAAASIVPRLFDENPDVRRCALRAAQALVRSGDAGGPIREGLDRIVASGVEPEHRKLLAIDAIGELRLGGAVPSLIAALSDASAAVGRAAHRALIAITGADPGRDRWGEWWRREGTSKAL